MATKLSAIEELLASRIGLDPVSVGSPLIAHGTAANEGARAGRHDRLRTPCVRVSRRVTGIDRGCRGLGKLVFPRRAPFQWFREYVRSHWLGDKLRPPLRVLSLPCAGGEEPYSIAMTMRNIGLPVHRFQIDAVDISAQRLAMARRGVYSANAFRGPDLSFQSRYFHKSAQGYELDSSIRSTVRFVQASVLDPRLLEGSSPYNIVFCRNLLIYLGIPARLCLLTAIERLLTADGLLLIGHADRLDVVGMEPRFAVVGDPACFVYRPRSRTPFYLRDPSSLPRRRSQRGSLQPAHLPA